MLVHIIIKERKKEMGLRLYDYRLRWSCCPLSFISVLFLARVNNTNILKHQHVTHAQNMEAIKKITCTRKQHVPRVLPAVLGLFHQSLVSLYTPRTLFLLLEDPQKLIC